jgi:hypothetical protein
MDASNRIHIKAPIRLEVGNPELNPQIETGLTFLLTSTSGNSWALSIPIALKVSLLVRIGD